MKKIISILLTLTLCLSLTSFAWADGTVATIGENSYNSLEAAINAAVNGDTIVLEAGEYVFPSATYSGKEITIQAKENAEVSFDMSAAKALHDAKITFVNVTFNYKTNGNYIGLQHTDTLVYNNCTINGQVFLYANSETFNSCTFNQTSAGAYNVWTYGAKQVTFSGCKFNCVGKSVLVYNEGANTSTNLKVVDSNFIASAPVEGKAAIEIDTSLMANGATIEIDSATTATGFAEGSNSGNTLWNDKKQTEDTNKDVTVIVGNQTVFEPKKAILCNNKQYDSIEDALADMTPGADGTTIILQENITVSNPITISKKIEIYMNGKTITGTDGTNGCRVFNVVAGGELELTGEGVVTTGAGNFNPDSSVIRVGDDSDSDKSASLVVGADVTINAPVSYGVAIFGTNNGQTLTVDGKILAVNRPAISGNGRAELKTTQITINNGAVVRSTNKIAIYHPQNGTLTINAATITGTGGIEAKAGTVIINKGAVITATADDATHDRNDGDPSTNGYALAVVQNPGYKSPAKVTVKGGTFVGPVAALNDEENADADKTTLSISGGTFSTDPSAYVTGDFTATKGPNGMWTVAQTVTPDPAPVDPQPERPAHTNRRYPANNTTTTTTDTKKDNVTSARTFDAGIAMYVGMSLLSVAGSAVVIGKKKEF